MLVLAASRLLTDGLRGSDNRPRSDDANLDEPAQELSAVIKRSECGSLLVEQLKAMVTTTRESSNSSKNSSATQSEAVLSQIANPSAHLNFCDQLADSFAGGPGMQVRMQCALPP